MIISIYMCVDRYYMYIYVYIHIILSGDCQMGFHGNMTGIYT